MFRTLTVASLNVLGGFVSVFLLPIMPSRTEDYEVLSTIGSGSYGKCQKIRRKSDGKVTRVDLMTPLHSLFVLVSAYLQGLS